MDKVKQTIEVIRLKHKRDIVKARLEGFWVGAFLTTFIIIGIWSLGKVLEKIWRS